MVRHITPNGTRIMGDLKAFESLDLVPYGET
jgi:hypothetical protein